MEKTFWSIIEMFDWIKVFLTVKYVSFGILLLQMFNQLSRRDCYGTMPYVVIMLSRDLILAITEQVFFEICRDPSWKRNEHKKRKMSLTWIISKVRWNVGLLQKINCLNFGSINAQKNRDGLLYANNLRPYLPSESKLSSTDGNWKQYFYK